MMEWALLIVIVAFVVVLIVIAKELGRIERRLPAHVDRPRPIP
jgi:uncharacterized protein YoxC